MTGAGSCNWMSRLSSSLIRCSASAASCCGDRGELHKLQEAWRCCSRWSSEAHDSTEPQGEPMVVEPCSSSSSALPSHAASTVCVSAAQVVVPGGAAAAAAASTACAATSKGSVTSSSVTLMAGELPGSAAAAAGPPGAPMKLLWLQRDKPGCGATVPINQSSADDGIAVALPASALNGDRLAAGTIVPARVNADLKRVAVPRLAELRYPAESISAYAKLRDAQLVSASAVMA